MYALFICGPIFISVCGESVSWKDLQISYDSKISREIPVLKNGSFSILICFQNLTEWPWLMIIFNFKELQWTAYAHRFSIRIRPMVRFNERIGGRYLRSFKATFSLSESQWNFDLHFSYLFLISPTEKPGRMAYCFLHFSWSYYIWRTVLSHLCIRCGTIVGINECEDAKR